MINSRTVPSFWENYSDLPDTIRKQSKKAFEIWKENPFHPSLRFKCIESKNHIWSLRITLGYRALCVFEDDAATWFWIGDHQSYERIIK
jgi:mRNA-degrading endonuclease RelE of RelBE toxin-antitoxin system